MHIRYFQSLQNIPNLRHAITTRDGGVSVGGYDSLNLGFHVGDEADAVRENRRRVAHELGFDEHDLICAQQVHGARCQSVTPEDRRRGAYNWDSALPNTDAIICEFSDTPVMILVADCAPILIVDAAHEVLAVVHAGWRGAVAGVAGNAVKLMIENYGSQQPDLRVGIGPCLCVECLEIGEEVAAGIQSTFIVRREDWPRPHLDLRAMIVNDLTRRKVLSSHIEAWTDCPRCENSKYFSHRAQNGAAGRFGLIAWWK